MNSRKYSGMDVHKESISIAVRNDAGKIVMECVIETKASMILDFIAGLRGDSHVTFVCHGYSPLFPCDCPASLIRPQSSIALQGMRGRSKKPAKAFYSEAPEHPRNEMLRHTFTRRLHRRRWLA